MPISCKCILDHLLYKSAITVDQYDKILRNLKGIEWHPYPKETPAGENGYYLVTALRGGEHIVCTAWWIDESYRFGVFTDRVTAWAELPKPYEGGTEE